MAARRFVLGGRAFVEMYESTFLHDSAAIALIYRAGLEGMQPEAGETAAAFGLRATVRIIESGQVPELLGTLLIPEGTPDVDWSRAITETSEKKALWAATTEVLFPFLNDALAFLASSHPSSSPAADDAQAATPSAPGAPSSEASPGTVIPITGR
jgi:hypothetical protein